MRLLRIIFVAMFVYINEFLDKSTEAIDLISPPNFLYINIKGMSIIIHVKYIFLFLLSLRL